MTTEATAPASGVPADQAHTDLWVERTGTRRYTGRSSRGAEVLIGSQDVEGVFTPGELLKIALAACSGMSSDQPLRRRLGDDDAHRRVDLAGPGQCPVDGALRVGEDAGVVVRVADLATGRSADGERVQLSTYVLMWRLDAVIDAAELRPRIIAAIEGNSSWSHRRHEADDSEQVSTGSGSES